MLMFALVWAQLALVLTPLPLAARMPASAAEAAVPPGDFGKLPLSFVPNAGQEDARVQFKTQAMGGTIFFTPQEIVLALPVDRSSTAADARVRVQFEGANRSPAIAGEQTLPGVFNSMIGNDPATWHTNIPTYGGIVYQGLYDGIDMRYEGSAGNLKSIYFVAPGVDPAQLRWRYNGASAVGVDRASGALHIALPGAAAPMVEQAPVAWQDIGGQRVAVAASFAIAQDGSVGFALGSYNPAYTLTIDPVLSYGTYLGGAGFDAAYDIAVASDNSVYVTGRSESATFAGQAAASNGDVFVVKLDAAGGLVYTSILGGNNLDEGRSIAVDGAGAAYITGSTFSSGFSGAINAYTGSADVFVTKLDAAGANPATRFIGGDAADVGNGIAVDGSFIYVTGYTDAPNTVVFPAAGGGTASAGGGTDAFYSKLADNALLTLSYSSYLGGLSNEEGRDIAVSGGNAYIVGRTGPNFPSGTKTGQAAFGGGNTDAFIVRYDGANAIAASTYLGGTGDDEGYGIAVDASNNAYVTGATRSPAGFTASPFQAGYAGLNDGFVARWDGAAFTYSTYLGGTGDDTGRAIAVVGSEIVVAGRTRSSDFPKPAAQALNGTEDAFVTRINPATNSLVYSTYVGGEGDEVAYGVGIQSDGVAVIAGQTNSTSGISSATGYQTTYGGGTYDAFVSKVTQPTVSFAVPASEDRPENNVTPFNAVVQLSAASNQDVTVQVAVDAGATATYGTDYTTAPVLPATVTITAGLTSMPVAIAIVNDAFPEPTESFTMTLSAPINASLGAQPSKRINILDDDSPPDISISDVTVAEGDSGTTAAVFTVTLSKGFVNAVSVDYATANGTATTADSDYNLATGTLTFAPGETTRPITVTINGDTTYEADETFTVTLSNPSNAGPQTAAIVRGTGTGTITNDDAAIGMTITGPAPVTEGNAGTTNADFTVTLTATAGVQVTVNYATADGTATAGADYTNTSGTLTFAPGETSKTVSVPVLGDTLDENDETFTLNLSNPNPAAILLPVPPQATATITDDDAAPDASISDVTVTEGNAGQVNADFAVTLTAASAKTITMTATTADGSAAAGADYTATTVTLTFAPGETTKIVSVPVLGDTIDEDDETFVVNLSGEINVTIADTQGVGTITDDDAEPTLAIDSVTLPEGDSGTTAFNFTVTLTGSSARTVTVAYSTQDGTTPAPATAPSDYTAASGTLTFAPGETTKTITVNVNGDTTDEDDEQFFVDLATPTNATIATAQGSGIIGDDDGPVLSVTNGAVLEGNSGTTAMVFTATLAEASLQDVSVTYATQDGTATAGTDYVAVAPTTLVFPAGSTEQQFTVTVNGDRVTEADEQFTIVLSDVVQAKLPVTSVTGTIVNDDTTPVAINDAYTTDEDTVLVVAAAEGVLANDNDPDADESLTVALVEGPASGTLALQPDGSFTYTPVENFYGVETFTYQVTDLGGNVSNIATVTITINSVNDPATAADDFAFVGKNQPTRINVLANDSPGPDPDDSLTITEITFAPTSGTVAITNGGTDVTYTPNLDYKGNDTFVYQVCDNDTPQYCATARVTLTVGLFRVSMPLIAKLPQADLVGTLSITPATVQQFQRVVLTAQVTNQGTAPASNFWVDLHVNPRRVPRVNEPWNEICDPRACRGVAWFVTQPVQPGETITLTSTPDSYVKENTIWLGYFPRGEQRFYLYVDSWNRDPSNTKRNPNASVDESNETNNLFELDINVTAGSTDAAPAQTPDQPNVADLAPRSLEPRADQ